MRTKRAAATAAWFTMGLCGLLVLGAQQLPFEPAHDSGQSITGAFEGWFANPDGSLRILVGYYNRNLKQELDIPPGPNNRIEPGGPDQGQPTHFLPGRQWGVFTITVPKDFGDRRLTWTIVANGQTTVIPLDVNTLWELSPFVDANGNAPPFIGFGEGGPFVLGPAGQSTSLKATTSEPLPLTVWVADDAHPPNAGPVPRTSPVTVAWSKFRGPGKVTFSNERPPVEKADFSAPASAKFSGKASTTATFSDPGEYILRVVANDWSGEGGRGFQCCWSNAQVKVSVK
ncbi:MAG TPA: hypothetical protein VKU19_38435 [Bryobacteraceae bacterium]|nr:hypothetical protein [Bryobacteraceae bacterium]